VTRPGRYRVALPAWELIRPLAVANFRGMEVEPQFWPLAMTKLEGAMDTRNGTRGQGRPLSVTAVWHRLAYVICLLDEAGSDRQRYIVRTISEVPERVTQNPLAKYRNISLAKRVML